MFTYLTFTIIFSKKKISNCERESWLIGSLTGAVVFKKVAKYIQI